MWAPASAYLELDVPRKPGLFALVCLTAASLVVTTVWLSHFQANDPNVQHERHRIRVLCIALPSRVAHISGQFAALERLAPGEFDMTVMEAVASVDDPRVAGWSSRAVFEDKEAAIEGSGGKPYLCYLSHVLAAGIIAAEKAALPSIVIEDDVLLHSDFYRVVPAILRRPARFPEDGLLQLGYSPQFDPKPDASREVIQWDATAFCIFVARESVRVHSVPAPHACSAAAAGDRAFSVGRALEEWSWGTQGYAQTASRALNLWKSRFDGVNVKLTVENQVYLATHPYRVSPPLLVPDFSFESTLGHDTGLADVYASFTGFVDWSDYTRSPLVCPAPSVGSAALTSSCLSATNNHWTLRAVEDSQGKSFQFSLSRRSNLCLAVSDRADVAASGDAGADVAATAGKATLQVRLLGVPVRRPGCCFH